MTISTIGVVKTILLSHHYGKNQKENIYYVGGATHKTNRFNFKKEQIGKDSRAYTSGNGSKEQQMRSAQKCQNSNN